MTGNSLLGLAILLSLVALDPSDRSHSHDQALKERNAFASRPKRGASTSGPGASLVSVNGRQLVVRTRNQDGTLAPPISYVMRGVAWSPASQNTVGTPVGRRPEFFTWKDTDIQLMKAMNVNTVYTYLDPDLDDTGTSVLDQLYNNGIMVVMTVDESGSYNLTRLQQAVSFYKDHPAILAWSIGNEWNINRYHHPTDSILEAAIKTEQAARLIKSLDTNHPVATSYGDIDINDTGSRLSEIRTM